MRGRRGLLLVAIVVVIAAVAGTYYQRRRIQEAQLPLLPAGLPEGVGAAAQDWYWARNIGSRTGVEIRARNFRHLQDPERIELEDVELRLYHPEGRRWDRVRCARAVFDPVEAVLHSDGDVEFTMGLRPEEPQGRLVLIRTSGVTFENRTGRAMTERPLRFRFEGGEGTAVGASYDPASRELHLRGRVELMWKGRGPGSRPMRLEAGELIYKENDSIILLFPWSRLRRENTVLEAGDAIVVLEESSIRRIEARAARGQEQRPSGVVRFAAAQAWIDLTPAGEVEKITAEGQASAVWTGENGQTSASASRLDLEFVATRQSSVLRRVLATGQASLLSEPAARPDRPAPEGRRLDSEVIQIEMRAAGDELDQVRTEAPGALEFIPRRAGQPRRRLTAERLSIHYADGNRIRSLRAVEVATRTDPDRDAKASEPLETWSRDLLAEFDPQSAELRRLEQWNDFRYREGARQGHAERAALDQASGRLTLEGAARVWDPEGSIAAERLELDRATGDLIAAGRVRSTQLPQRRRSSTALLSDQENLEAQAERLQTLERRSRFVYEGNVRLWQGANRLRAHRVEIDRAARRLVAEGQVVSEFADRRQTGGPVTFVVVRAARLAYSEQERVAHYSGGVRLERSALTIEAPELRAWLKTADAESALDRAMASGGVNIVHRAAARRRQATAETAEYYADEERAVLVGGPPSLTDDRAGQTRGERLSWRLRDDSFEVQGAPALSRLRRQ
jgi:lipopolysaccharide export system protein LptA